ncbi:HAD family hydrolase [Paenibacillus hexagrammi]|uniref:HAD family hydrolase n=1 Tax=Paenibacillus hexagrammi TaxID=2908839 RepID=A0ABY3SKT6_9BACL|nr:HAD family hydrolase [Paenibacillus sp. YPD9-1]UJF33597.1 HAD family hydrolase [Paenibacillus sp. YPD9-1]
MYKALVIDLDGTLLRSDKQLSRQSVDALIQSAAQGIKIIVATARPPRSVRQILPKEIVSICSFVYYNGALIEDAQTGFETHISIDKSVTSALLDYCSIHMPNCSISVEVKDKWFADDGVIDEEIFQTSHFQPHICSHEVLKTLDATKLLITYFEDPQDLIQVFKEQAHVVLTDRGTLIQMMNCSVSKATGISLLLNRFAIFLPQVIVFGDDYNDLELFTLPCCKVAMSNAIDELKALADFVTDSNDNDGVAKIIELVLKQQLPASFPSPNSFAKSPSA